VTATLEWEKLTTKGAAPSPRDKLTAVAVGPVIYIFGGFGPPKGVVPKMPYLHGEDQEEEPEPSDPVASPKPHASEKKADEKKEDEESIDEEDAADHEGEEDNPDDYESEEEPPATLFDWFGDLYAFDTRE
jgi:hypothetical protein